MSVTTKDLTRIQLRALTRLYLGEDPATNVATLNTLARLDLIDFTGADGWYVTAQGRAVLAGVEGMG